MAKDSAEAWKSATLARTFLEGVRGGIPFAAEQIDVMLRLIEARKVPVGRVLDLGCGDGVLTRAILARHPRAQCALVDFSEPMLDAARAQLGDREPPPQFVSADLGTPDWRCALTGAFDVIVSGYAIHHLPDARKRELYSEIFALLAAGGIFVNIEHVASPTPWLESIADNLMIDSLYAFQSAQNAGRTRSQVADKFVHRPDKAANILAPVETQCGWLHACGFEDVDCYFKVFELAVFGGRRPA
jgi:trans-aconitate methyltransferase